MTDTLRLVLVSNHASLYPHHHWPAAVGALLHLLGAVFAIVGSKSSWQDLLRSGFYVSDEAGAGGAHTQSLPSLRPSTSQASLR